MSDFGDEVRRLLAERGMSLREAGRRSHFDASYLSKVVNGHKPGTRYMARVLDDVLGAGGELAELAARTWPAAPHGAAGTMSAGQAGPWELADVLTRSPVSATALDFMERAITGFAACYPYTPPANLAPQVQAMLGRMKDALSLSQPVRARTRCVRLAGVLCGVAGQIADDMGRHAQAGEYFEVGGIAAAEIGDLDLTAWILGVRSIGVFFRSAYPEAIAMLGRAQDAAEGCAPRRRAWLDALSARALAALTARAGGQHRGHREVMASLDR
ncbi:MAG TPA: helix-turn-helix domain-containing protein, partial [Streptosporangiaceae bacterium]|nr:helix-turn-helix domain-containing protein [Streptosporangiaceae bacterium]